jgi:hypothetical protein
MRFLGISLVIAMALALGACSSKSSSNTSSSSDQSSAASASAEPSAADTSDSGASPAPSEAATTAAGQIPTYPGATTAYSGSSSNMGQSAAGTVMTTDDSFDKVYSWYQSHMPAGSEKAHVTAPVQSAVFTIGSTPQDQTSVSITVSGGKTMITVGHVKQQ